MCVFFSHQINPINLSRESEATVFTRFEGKHSFEGIAELLNSVRESMGLREEQTVATATANDEWLNCLCFFVKCSVSFVVDDT